MIFGPVDFAYTHPRFLDEETFWKAQTFWSELFMRKKKVSFQVKISTFVLNERQNKSNS